MSDEEEDYMSSKFLEEAASFENQTKQETYSERRKRQLREQREKGLIKPRHVLEKEEREKGLKTAVDTSNKGMQMLMKMGFKQGTALGKKGTEGIVEPIKVDMRNSREGLGMSKKREREEEEEFEKKKLHMDPDEFRTAMAQRAKENQYQRYVVAAVSICQNFDEEAGVESNILWVLKPEKEDTEDDNNEGKEEEKEDGEEQKEDKLEYPPEQVEELKSLPLEEKIERLTSYLREKYFYCFWCKAKYADKEDLDENCPGLSEDDH